MDSIADKVPAASGSAADAAETLTEKATAAASSVVEAVENGVEKAVEVVKDVIEHASGADKEEEGDEEEEQEGKRASRSKSKSTAPASKKKEKAQEAKEDVMEVDGQDADAAEGEDDQDDDEDEDGDGVGEDEYEVEAIIDHRQTSVSHGHFSTSFTVVHTPTGRHCRLLCLGCLTDSIGEIRMYVHLAQAWRNAIRLSAGRNWKGLDLLLHAGLTMYSPCRMERLRTGTQHMGARRERVRVTCL